MTMKSNAKDIEAVTKAVHTAQFLCHELGELVKSDNLLLSDICLAELEKAGLILMHLKRLQSNLESMAG